MPAIQTVATALFLAFAVGAGTATGADAAGGDATLRAEIERISRWRIYFGHQSVGENLLEGIKDLSQSAGVAVNIASASTASGVGPATFGHVRVPENGKPLQKLEAFERAMGTQPAGIDVALVKFCYVDFRPETDAKALFARYRATLADLQTKHPGTTFVHVTVPLTVVKGGPKEFLRGLIGRPPWETLANFKREEYNALLRQVYGGREPVFDLARVESTAPDGSAVTIAWQGRSAPALAPAYTEDGGHLNAAGRLRAAREMVSVIAAAPDTRRAQPPMR
jgi:hypothetical protein